MSFCSLISLIKKKLNKETKSFIKRTNFYSAVDESRNTLLHYAAEYGNPEIVQFLIDWGIDVDARNDFGQTPLIKSLGSDLPCKKVVEVLLEAGAKITLLDSVCQSSRGIVNSKVWLNEDIRRFEILKIFFERTTDVRYFSILREGDEGIIKSFLQTDVNLSTTDQLGRTVVHILAENLNTGVIEQLHGKNVDVNVSDKYGWTPLMFAARLGNVNAVEFLLNEGADIEASSIVIGKTAFYIAIYHRSKYSNSDIKRIDFQRIVQILLEYGANVEIQIYNRKVDYIETIFDLLMEDKNFELAEVPLAHLALKEAFGMTISNLIRIRLNEYCRLQSYFEYCQQQLSTEIYPSITLFDVLTESERKLELYLRNEKLASKLIDLQTSIYYFDTILCRRISEACQMIELRKTAAEILCKLMKIEYNSYPFVFDKIVNYLEKQDIENLITIQNLLF